MLRHCILVLHLSPGLLPVRENRASIEDTAIHDSGCRIHIHNAGMNHRQADRTEGDPRDGSRVPANEGVPVLDDKHTGRTG